MTEPNNIERRGMDPAVVAYIGTLQAHFEKTHSQVHDDHAREHEQDDKKLLSEVHCIKDYYNALLEEQEKRYSERFIAQQTAMEAAFKASEEALRTALIEKEKSVEAAFAASEKAILKAEVSIEKRADATYVSLNELQRSLGNLMPRAESEARIANIDERVANLNSRQDRQEGTSKGISTTTAAVATIVTIIISIVTILVVVLLA